MGTKKYKPTSPAIRSRSVLDFKEITESTPQKSLLKPGSNRAGRNNTGRITVRRRGGGAKRKYRQIDFKRDKDGIEGVVKSIEYDPNRSGNIALVDYKDGEKRYILAPAKVKVGAIVKSGEKADIKVGHCLKIKDIPTGTIIHNVEISIDKGGQIARSAGCYAVLAAKSGKYATVKLPSGEVRLINIECRASIGEMGNSDKRNTCRGKAGCSRWLRKRPKVRGTVMNPCDHPHGGGEGRAPIGLSGPRTPWGKPTLGYKTRKKENKFLVKNR